LERTETRHRQRLRNPEEEDACRESQIWRKEIEPELLADTLDFRQRFTLGAIHPAFRSGEDLPTMGKQETEIARFTLAKTIHMEVTSIRARKVGSRIRYRVVCEGYEGMCDYDYKTRPRSSTLPLSFGELTRLIDETTLFLNGKYEETGLLQPIWERCETTDLDDLRGEIDADSLFYPSLDEWCEFRLRSWVRQRSISK
jgi:hypothetical protein